MAKQNGIAQGIFYALVPHTMCIAFLIGSIFGVTLLMQFFKPLLMNRYFFYLLIAISFAFATLSALLYLRKNGLLSALGAKRKWKYLTGMYGSTIGINLALFLLIFPMLANASPSNITGGALSEQAPYISTLKMSVDIPCSGHAPLITSELKTITGVLGVQFSFPNNFEVTYDNTKTNQNQMLALDVFKEYPATVASRSLQGSAQQQTVQTTTTDGGGTCGASCGGGCGCGGR
jgi:hypothetical protein